MPPLPVGTTGYDIYLSDATADPSSLTRYASGVLTSTFNLSVAAPVGGDRERQIEAGANRGNMKTSPQKPLAQPGIDEWCLPSRVGADEQAGICVLDAGNGRIKQIPRAVVGIELSSVLTTVQVRRPKLGQEFF